MDRGRRLFDNGFCVLDINAQARKLQRNRAKGATTLQHDSSFCRSLSETSLNLVGVTGEEPKRYSTLPGSGRARSDGRKDGGGVKHSLYQSPHLLLLQGYNRQVSDTSSPFIARREYRNCARRYSDLIWKGVGFANDWWSQRHARIGFTNSFLNVGSSKRMRWGLGQLIIQTIACVLYKRDHRVKKKSHYFINSEWKWWTKSMIKWRVMAREGSVNASPC